MITYVTDAVDTTDTTSTAVSTRDKINEEDWKVLLEFARELNAAREQLHTNRECIKEITIELNNLREHIRSRRW